MTRGPLGVLPLVWGLLVGGVATYTLVVYGLLQFGTLEFGLIGRDVVNVAGALVLVYLCGAVALRRMMVARIRSEPGPRRAARYQSATLVVFALMESGGLVLVTLGMLADAPGWVLAGGGAAATLMYFARPTPEDIGL